MSTATRHSNRISPPRIELSLILRRESGGPELTRVPIDDAELADVKSELWLEGWLRRGHHEVPFEDAQIEVAPRTVAGGDPRCEGLVVTALPPSGIALRREYGIDVLHDPAAWAAQQLTQSGVLKLDDKYIYELVSSPRTSAAESSIASRISFTSQSAALGVLPLALAPLLERARVVGEVDDRSPAVFFTERALERAERFARRGADLNPPVETGAALAGPLCGCPDTGELFAVVTDALEAADADQSQFSLSYTGKTWSRIQAAIRARRNQPATRAHRLLGQAHGHNFVVGGGAPPCEVCHKVAVCSRRSDFVSLDDRFWSRACFPQSPWQLCHIFGLNARNEQVSTLYGLRDNRLQPRGYHVIPDFP